MIPESAYGFTTCLYAMSLEAWRRGLEVTFKLKPTRRYFNGISYIVSDGINQHLFDGSMGDVSDPKTVSICRNKGETNKYLRKAAVPMPIGKAFTSEVTNDEILKYADEIGYPLVLKPIDGGGGLGVTTNIKSRKKLGELLIELRNKRNRRSVIVEHFFEGEDYRIVVLDGNVIGAFHRRAQSVIGDGKNSIRELLRLKNRERRVSPFLKGSLIKIDKDMINFLKEGNKSTAYVPKENERVYLRRNGEFFGQRDAVNITDTLSPHLKEAAVQAVKAIPGLRYGGVDMLVNTDTDECIINEVNAKPQIGNHLFPLEGEAIDIPRIIFDYYFPKTRYKETPNKLYYYDFEPVKSSFLNFKVSEVQLPSLPNERFEKLRLNIEGNKFNSRKFLNNIKRQMRGLNISGEVIVHSTKELVLYIAGLKHNLKNLINYLSTLINIDSLQENEYEGPVKIGFELINQINVGKELRNENKILQNENRLLQNEINILKNEINRMKDSKSWKYTSLFRKK